MFVKDKKEFAKGGVLAVSFLVLLFIMFLPIFEGHNAFVAADKLFNSISKDSSYRIGGLIKKSASFNGQSLDVAIRLENQRVRDNAKKLLTAAGCQVSGTAGELIIKGDLGKVMRAALTDSDDMFYDREAEVKARYGLEGREALYAWWRCFKAMDFPLKRLGKPESFKQAAFLGEIVKKGLEVGYNFFRIAPQSARSKAGILTFALCFYVVYTLWWGIAILFMFEGIGLQMTAGTKKEV
ncbi:MAG: hypothetical protein WBG50_14185 [Desulfomonilaceae bacterium]